MRNILLVVVIACAAAIGFSQTDSGAILGSVTDSSGAVIPGATIAIENQNTGLTKSLTSDARGSFLAPSLPIGVYRVSVSANGFGTQVKEGLTLQISDRMQLVFALQPGSVSQSVQVTDHAPLVDTATTDLGGVISKQQVADLPLNGRSVVELIALVPGVELRGNSNQMSLGGKGEFTNEGGLHFLLDGGDASRVDFDDLNNTYGASAGRISRESVDAVEEFRVYTDAYSAEYGDTQGGVINLVTKSGTNQMHGSLYEYFRNQILDARDYFNPYPQAQPAFRLNQFGGSAGGPIKRKKLFYFGDYEGVQQRTGQYLSNYLVPTAAARAAAAQPVQQALSFLPLPNGSISSDPNFGYYSESVSDPLTENTFVTKIDYDMSSADHLSGRYNFNKNLTEVYTGIATGQVQTDPGLMQLAMIDYTHTFSPRLLNDFDFYFNRFHVDPLASNIPAIILDPIVNFGEGANVGPGLFNLHVATNSFTWKDNLTWVHNHHQIKMGGGVIRNEVNKELGYEMIVTYLTFAQAQANQAYQDTTIGFPRIGIRNTYYYAYGQDDYQVARRLVLNVGLRYQLDTSPTEAHNRITNFNFSTGELNPQGSKVLDTPTLDFAPRFGFAYSVNSDSSLVLRGGYGIFFSDLNAGNLAQNMPSNLPNFGFSASVNDLQVPGLVGLPFPNISTYQVPTKNFSAIVTKYREPYSEKWNLNVQEALGKNASLQIGYLGARGLHLINGENMNRLYPGGQSQPYPQYGSINTNTTSAISMYNAMQVTFHKIWNNGLTFNTNYTWSHSLDDDPTIFGSYQDDHNPLGDYGASDFDVRHIVEADGSYAFPAIPAIPKVIGAGWQYNTIAELRSGFPFSVTCGCDPELVGQATSRADIVPGVNPKPANFSEPTNQLNPAAFAVPVGHFGTMQRNSLYGPNAINFDMSVFKNFRLVRENQLAFRAEAFNIFNHPQFSNPNTGLNNLPLLGDSTSDVTTPEAFHTDRELQFSLRYSF